MKSNNAELYMKCLAIEALVKVMVLQGITNNKKLVEAVDTMYPQVDEWEQEMFSEAIIYAKQGILN
jgi:hypothetical protein